MFNLIELALTAEKLFQHQPNINFSGRQCIRSKDTRADCQLCVDYCPTNAVKLVDGIPDIESDSCIRCGVCLHTCPAGAFERADGVHKLLNCAESILDHDTLDLTCGYHPSPGKTDRGVDAVIQTNTCLSELGPSVYIGLKAIGVKDVRIRQDTCSQCPLRVLQPQIEQSVHQAQQILSSFDMDDELTIVSEVKAAWRKKAVYRSSQPPVSRRDLFTMFTSQKESTASAITNLHDNPSTGKHTSRERQRLLNALRILVASDASSAVDAILDNEGFAQFAVNGSCTACGLCERACPVGAIEVEKTQTDFAINFAPDQCINCGLCVAYCDPKALEFIGRPSAEDVIDGVRIRLYAGMLRQCKRCKTSFAGTQEETLCPTCQSRFNNESGKSLPDAVLAKLPEETRQKLTQHLRQRLKK